MLSAQRAVQNYTPHALAAQIENYAGRCSGPVDHARYAEGLQSGLAMRPRIAAF